MLYIHSLMASGPFFISYNKEKNKLFHKVYLTLYSIKCCDCKLFLILKYRDYILCLVKFADVLYCASIQMIHIKMFTAMPLNTSLFVCLTDERSFSCTILCVWLYAWE